MKEQEQHLYGKFNFYAALYYFFLLVVIITILFFIFATEKRQSVISSFENLSHKLGFKVHNLELNTLNNLDANDLAQQIDIANKPILSLDLHAIRQTIESNSWVEEAVVERVLPNQIKVTILEHEPKAIWQDKEKFYLVKEQGEIIKQVNKADLAKFSDLILFTGEDALHHLGEVFQLFAYDQQLKNKIKAAIYISKRRWDIMMENNMLVKLPPLDHKKAWQYFLQLDKELDLINNAVISVDLRVAELLFLELDPKNSRNRKLLRRAR